MKEKKSRRILIIEDNADSAETLQILLEMNEHKVEIALDGESGITKALDFLPDVIICDIGLTHKMDGHEVASAVRNNENLKSVFLIALSGYGESEDVKKSESVGFNHHLIKPPDFDKLISLVENL